MDRTRRQLADALVELSLEHGFETVTVRDLTARAGVGYATFFRHYPDKETLLSTMLKEAIAALVAAVSGLTQEPEAMVTTLFQRLGEHPDLYRALLRTRNVTGLFDRVIGVGSRLVLSTTTPRPGSNVPPDIAAHHLIAATVNLIEWWLERGMPHPPERMGQIVAALVMHPVYETVLLPETGLIPRESFLGGSRD